MKLVFPMMAGRIAPGVVLSLVACATVEPIAPPPGVDSERLAEVRQARPEIADEVDLLEWQARQAAASGDRPRAEQSARLARLLMRAYQPVKTATVTCPADTVRPQPADEVEQKVAESKPTRRRRRKRAKPETKLAIEPTIESLMQARAEALQRLDGSNLDPDGRVWLDAGRRALIEAQRAVSAGATERARQQLLRVDQAIEAIRKEPRQTTRSSTVTMITPLESLARDLSSISPLRSESWLVVQLPESPEPTRRVSRQQEDSLRALGRLMRVYGGAQLCIGSKTADAASAVRRYLERIEQLPGRRFVPCHPKLQPEARLFVGLTFSPRRI